MPVRYRRSKARMDDLPAWVMTFQAGFDYFDELPGAGVETDAYGRPPRPVAIEAWHRLGAVFLAQYRDIAVEPWALLEFGEPQGSRKLRRRG